MLETLQAQLGLTDAKRANIEEKWLGEISRGERRSFGDGDSILREWLEALDDRDALDVATRTMGRAALESGLSKNNWKEGLAFAEGLGLENALAEGAWLEVNVQAAKEWPSALDPLAIILGLVIQVPDVVVKEEIKLAKGSAFVKINHPDAKNRPLSWMPDLLPLDGEGCTWGWGNEIVPDTEAPAGDLALCNSVILAWIRRFVSMRNKRGETDLSDLPDGVKMMPSSSELSRDGQKLTLSMIVDLGDSGLVRPWASVIVSGVPVIQPAPDGLAENWASIHDALATLLISALESLPRQLLIASGLNMQPTNIRAEEGWLVYDLISQ
jgi:hypothetical protein